MKTIKLLLLPLFFVAGQQAIAQNVIVNNNNPTTAFDIAFDFGGCGGAVFTNTPPMSSTATPYPAPCPLILLKVSFTDFTCAPPQPVGIAIMYTANPTYYTYVLCDGTVINFRVHFNGIDYIVDIV